MNDRELMQQALDALERADKISGYGNNKATTKALRARLSAPEPEPVAWMNEAGDIVTSDESYTIGWRPLYTAPPQHKEPEPVARTCTRCQGKGRIYMGCDEWIHCSTCNETGVVHTPQLREKNT